MISFYPDPQPRPKGVLASLKARFAPAPATGLFGPIGDKLRSEFPQALRIGLVAPTGPDIIEAWDACLHAGREPMILHYPTAKL